MDRSADLARNFFFERLPEQSAIARQARTRDSALPLLFPKKKL
jgi:hypothetical protein